MSDSKRITVVGAGFMGSVIATIYARYGYEVLLHDTDGKALETYGQRALPIAESLARAGDGAADIVGRVRTEARLEAAVEGAFLVHEVVQEDLAIKQALFRRLDGLCGPEVVLGTNTSSFLLTHLCRDVKRRERVIGIHYISPAHIIRAVEVIVADFTAPERIAWARQFLQTIDHVGIVCRESPGFLVNRIQLAMLAEIHRIVDEGLASAADVDAAVRLALGPRWALWGALLCEDLAVNKRTALAVLDYLREQTGENFYASTPALRRLVAEDHQGAISGQGWYRWKAPYPEVVKERDRQLREIVDWLGARDSVGRIGVDSDLRAPLKITQDDGIR